MQADNACPPAEWHLSHAGLDYQHLLSLIQYFPPATLPTVLRHGRQKIKLLKLNLTLNAFHIYCVCACICAPMSWGGRGPSVQASVRGQHSDQDPLYRLPLIPAPMNLKASRVHQTQWQGLYPLSYFIGPHKLHSKNSINSIGLRPYSPNTPDVI